MIVVPGAYRLWPDPPRHQVLLNWAEATLVVNLPGEPVITLTETQRKRLWDWLTAAPHLFILMTDHNGRHRLEGRLERG